MKPSARYALLTVGMPATGIGTGWLVLYEMTRTRTSIQNRSNAAIDNVTIDFAGPLLAIGPLAPASTTSHSRMWIGEGDLRVTFERNGELVAVVMGYITPHMRADCDLFIDEEAPPAVACRYGN